MKVVNKEIDLNLFKRWLFVQKYKAAERGDKAALKALCESKEEVKQFLDLKKVLDIKQRKKKEENEHRMVSMENVFSQVVADS